MPIRGWFGVNTWGLVAPDYPRPVAADWPDLLDVVETRVKPQRVTDNRENYARLWWQFGERRPGLLMSLRPLSETFVISQTSKFLGVAKSDSKTIFSFKVVVFPTVDWHFFCVLQSRIHEYWARFLGSSLEDRPVYTPSDCFETFPFPADYDRSPILEARGREYYAFRAALMVRNKQGLTKTYNRFHDPEEQSEDFKKLRELHHAMDRAILDAYGWTDIRPVAQHEAEFEEEATEEDDFSGAKKPKLKYRLRWSEEVRDDVLARLLILNAQRSAAEALEPRAKKKTKQTATPLFDSGELE